MKWMCVECFLCQIQVMPDLSGATERIWMGHASRASGFGVSGAAPEVAEDVHSPPGATAGPGMG